MTRKNKKWLAIALCAVMALTMTYSPNKQVSAEESKGALAPTILATPMNGDEVKLLDGDILEFLSNYEKGKSANYLPEGYNRNNVYREDDFAPKNAVLSWGSEEGAQYYTVKISTQEDMSNALSYVTLDTSLELSDLYRGVKYYYQVIAKFADKTVKSRIFDFYTADLTRTISLEGVSNTRDAGGFYTADGKYRTRQGIVYRGGKLENMTAEAKEKALLVYGFKTDLDLRAEATASPLGEGVNFVNVSGPYYIGSNVGIDSTKDSSKGPWKGTYRDALIKEIQTFAKPENYPIYVHCSLGRDRTGTIICLINALCGVGEMDLYKDYETSFFSEYGCLDGASPAELLNGAFTNLINYLKNYGVGNLSQNTEKFMLDIGITQAEINSIRSILLEEV